MRQKSYSVNENIMILHKKPIETILYIIDLQASSAAQAPSGPSGGRSSRPIIIRAAKCCSIGAFVSGVTTLRYRRPRASHPVGHDRLIDHTAPQIRAQASVLWLGDLAQPVRAIGCGSRVCISGRINRTLPAEIVVGPSPEPNRAPFAESGFAPAHSIAQIPDPMTSMAAPAGVKAGAVRHAAASNRSRCGGMCRSSLHLRRWI